MRKQSTLKPKKHRSTSRSKISYIANIFAKSWLGIILTLWTLCKATVAFTPQPHNGAEKHVSLKASLNSLTVPELRRLVKDSITERGVLSKLKRKQELIDFLESRKRLEDDAPTVTLAPIPTSSEAAKVPLSMPSHNPELLKDDNLLGETSNTAALSHRHAAFERLYRRYPMLQNYSWSGDTNCSHDIRQTHHPMLMNTSSADMELIFVGTASCVPSVTRGVSCTALRLKWRRRSMIWNSVKSRLEHFEGFQGGTWIFDVGECTQLQIQQTVSIRPSKITKIFITHAHGDHSFGLPGLLCLMGQNRDRDSPPVEIYGPEGLRMWLRVAIRYSVSRIVPPYRVHEIMDVPMAPEWQFSPRGRRFFYRRPKSQAGARWERNGLAGEDPDSWITRARTVNLEPSPMYGEIEGGRDIHPIYDHPMSFDGAPVWEVEDEEDVKVFASPMSHSVPSLGYVVVEQPRPGRLKNELVEPIVRRNTDALRNAGFSAPMKAMAVIKNLAPGTAFTFPDGTIVTQEEAVEPPRQGRKVVICGDTCSSRSLTKLASDADVIVHEATNCFLPGIDKGTSLKAVSQDAIVHGHSTPQIAGYFAKKVGAHNLVLNHFSARYKGDISPDSLSVMMRIEKRAILSSGLDETRVASAFDFMTLPIAHRTS